MQVVPALRQLNPAFLAAVSRMTETLSQDCEYLEREARALLERCRGPWGLEAAPLAQAHPALSSRALRLWCEGQGCTSLEKVHVEALLHCLGAGGEADLPGGFRACCSQGVLSLQRGNPSARGFLWRWGWGDVLPCGKVLLLEEKILENQEESQNSQFVVQKRFGLCYNYNHFAARSRRAGTVFPRLGGGCPRA